MADGKNPTWAAVLSLVIAGLGQLYLKKYGRAAFFLALELLTSALFVYDQLAGGVLNLLVSFSASYDAYVLASKVNEGLKPKVEEDIPVIFMK